jgi:DNA polymerase bacteriophage-type
MTNNEIIAIDFETYSPVDLRKHGLTHYVNDPHFQPLMAAVASRSGTTLYDFATAHGGKNRVEFAQRVIDAGVVVAHNAGFEAAVLNKSFGIDCELEDSAVMAAVMGASRHLAGAARQLLDIPKLDEDGGLVRKFCMPGKDQTDPQFDLTLPWSFPDEWAAFIDYCQRDAELSLQLYHLFFSKTYLLHPNFELKMAKVTQRMNEVGWPVDVDSVEEMQSQYQANLRETLEFFANSTDPDLNLNSSVQLKAWAAKRGLKSDSFDKDHVPKLIEKVRRWPDSTDRDDLIAMLHAKRVLGGSSPKKLQTILDTQFEGRLYDQYAHAGAAQTLRTSGRGVQMQNLKRLSDKKDMSSLSTTAWSNEEIANNLRQVFQAEHPDGKLIVADYSAMESRTLAYLAGEQWKIDAYAQGLDVYKALSGKIYHVPDLGSITPDQRQTGKVGELSCGYGAGPETVKAFAEKMRTIMSIGEAKKLVRDWRLADPKTVELWDLLHRAMHHTVGPGFDGFSVPLSDGMVVRFEKVPTPASLLAQAPAAQSVKMRLSRRGNTVAERLFHGCLLVNGDIHYHRPSQNKTGAPWSRTFTDPASGRKLPFKLWGGKLTGVLVQSTCREVFFGALYLIDRWTQQYDNVRVVGQFHDEVVLEWWPGEIAEAEVHEQVYSYMSYADLLPGLSLDATVKSDRRYVK